MTSSWYMAYGNITPLKCDSKEASRLELSVRFGFPVLHSLFTFLSHSSCCSI